MARTQTPEMQLSSIVQSKLNDTDAYLNETTTIGPSDYKYSLKESSFKVSFPETNGEPTTYLTLNLFNGTSYVESRRLLKETIDGVTFTDLQANSLKVGMAYEIFRDDAQNIYYRYKKSDVEDLEMTQSINFDAGRAMLVTSLSNGESVTTELTQNLAESTYYCGNLSQFTTTSNMYGFAVQPTGANNTYTNSDVKLIMDGIVRDGRELQLMFAINDQGVSGAGFTLYKRNSDSTISSTQFLRSDTSGTVNGKLDVTQGISIHDGDFIMLAGVLDDIQASHMLSWDGTTGKVSRIANSSMWVGSAETANTADTANHANHATDSDTLGGLGAGSFARTDSEEWFDQNVNFKNGMHITNGNLYANGYVYPQCTTANKTLYVKIAGSGYADNNPLAAYSTMRMGDIAIHLGDVPSAGQEDYIYRQQPLVDLGVTPRLNEEGENCIFLLDILEKMQTKMNEMQEEINTLKGV